MTETQYLACDEPWTLLEFLREQAGDREFRLFACACCRAVWPALDEEVSRKAVAVAEAFADGAVDRQALRTARKAAGQFAHYRPGWVAAFIAVGSDGWYAARDVIEPATLATAPPGEEESAVVVSAAQRRFAHLLRDIVGNPFHRLAVEPHWLTPTVVTFAQFIYDERAFDHLPILADALEEAGCTNVILLDHCRQPGEHVRGCWVVDLMLDRE